MKLFTRRARRAARLEIIPMIDVMFLLLVFYILSTAALTHQQTIPVDLPTAGTGEMGKSLPEVSVTLTRSGEVFLNQQKVEMSGLGAAVETLARTRPGGLGELRQAGVVLNADLQVRHREVVQVMDILRSLGIARFAIATDLPGNAP